MTAIKKCKKTFYKYIFNIASLFWGVTYFSLIHILYFFSPLNLSHFQLLSKVVHYLIVLVLPLNKPELDSQTYFKPLAQHNKYTRSSWSSFGKKQINYLYLLVYFNSISLFSFLNLVSRLSQQECQEKCQASYSREKWKFWLTWKDR